MPISTGLNSDRIRVGIILPEDKITNLRLRWSHDLNPDTTQINLSSTIELKMEITDQGQLFVQTPNSSTQIEGEFVLSTEDEVKVLKQGFGIQVEPVVAGRGFHWERKLSVDLPGTLIVSVVDGYLLLINELDVESYVACVATSEMGAEAPEALLAAQTVVARCWALALVEKKHMRAGFDVCNDDCCQRYQGTTFLTDYALKAAVNTFAEVLVFEDQVIDARYSKNCGGIVERYEAVWEGEPLPYLVDFVDADPSLEHEPLEDFESLWSFDHAYCSSHRFRDVNLSEMLGKVDVSGSYYRWKVEVPKSLLLDKLRRHMKKDWQALTNIQILKRGSSYRIAKMILVGETLAGEMEKVLLSSEYQIRQIFSESFLYSSAFVIDNLDQIAESDTLQLRGAGWGHGVGLCQMGALGMALEGLDYRTILLHYYPNTTIRKLQR